MFGKAAGAYPYCRVPQGVPALAKDRLGRKWPAVTNALAYSISLFIFTIKGFIVQVSREK